MATSAARADHRVLADFLTAGVQKQGGILAIHLDGKESKLLVESTSAD